MLSIPFQFHAYPNHPNSKNIENGNKNIPLGLG
jgi:hypothetical protein